MTTPVPQQGPSATDARPWLGVHFVCANRYLRVYRDVRGGGYLARCPQCSRCVNFRVGEGGCASRMFEVSCA